MINIAYKPQNPEIEKLQNAFDYVAIKAKFEKIGSLGFCILILLWYGIEGKETELLSDVALLLIINSFLLIWVANRLFLLSLGILLFSFCLISFITPLIERQIYQHSLFTIVTWIAAIYFGVYAIGAFNNYKNLSTKNLSSELIDSAKTKFESLKACRYKDTCNSVRFMAKFNNNNYLWSGYLLGDHAIFIIEKLPIAFVLEKKYFEIIVEFAGSRTFTIEINHPYFDSKVNAVILKSEFDKLKAWLDKNDVTAYKPQNPEIKQLQNALDYVCMKTKLLKLCWFSSPLAVTSIVIINVLLARNIGSRFYMALLIFDLIFLINVCWAFVKANRWIFLSLGLLFVIVGTFSLFFLVLKQKSFIDTILLSIVALFLFIRGISALYYFDNYKYLNIKNISLELIDIAKTNIDSLRTAIYKSAQNFVDFDAALNSKAMFRWRGYLLPNYAIFIIQDGNRSFVLDKSDFDIVVKTDELINTGVIMHPYFDTPIIVKISKTSLDRIQAWLEK